MCRGSCKNPLMRQGQKGLPGRGIQKVFPAPLSSPLLPRSRSEQELCRALQAAFHPLWFLSSSGLQSSQHQPCRIPPGGNAAIKTPLRGGGEGTLARPGSSSTSTPTRITPWTPQPAPAPRKRGHKIPAPGHSFPKSRVCSRVCSSEVPSHSTPRAQSLSRSKAPPDAPAAAAG